MYTRFILFLLRVSMGWVMFYAGITKILNPEWTAAGYLGHAKTFPDMFAWFADPSRIGVINLVNEWGLFLLGISLILGVGMRLSGILGAILMMLYYFPGLDFPMIGANSYIIDDHVIYAIVLLFLSVSQGARYLGLGWWFNRTYAENNSLLRKLLA